jgi:diacylglycerol kinase family enzyme
MDSTTPPQKLRWGKLAYLANAIGQSDELQAVRHVITVDGTRFETEASQVFVANQGRMLPIVEPRRRIEPDDGLLDVIVVRGSGVLPALLAGWDAMVQEDLGKSGDGRVIRAQGRSIEIETDPSRLVEVDGSVIGKTPVAIRVEPKALTVLVRR